MGLLALRLTLAVGALLNALTVFVLGGYDGPRGWIGGVGSGLLLAGVAGLWTLERRKRRDS